MADSRCLLTFGSATISSDATKISEPAAALPLGGGHEERFMQLCRITDPSFPVLGSLIIVEPKKARPSFPNLWNQMIEMASLRWKAL